MAMKRAVPSSRSQGPPSKKRAVEKPQKQTKPRHNESAQAKTRRKPVTATLDDDHLSSEDDDENEEFPLDFGQDLAEAGENAMDVDENSLPPKDPNASRESHKLQKEMMRQRQAAKPNASLIAEAKRHWSLARQKTIPRAEREQHVANLLKAVRGRVQDLVFKHDASRVVQTIVKCGGKKERETVALELTGRYRDLSQNKYGKFLVTKLLRYCPTLRSSILSEFHGHVLRLLLHREASPVIADAYELYASAVDRDRMLLDLYGKEVQLFAASASSEPMDGIDNKKPRGLKSVLTGADNERKKRVISTLRDNLMSIFDNPDKGAVGHSIVHRALWEYLQEINIAYGETEAEKKRRDIFENCQELVAEMVHTKDGSRSVREFLAQGSAKDRKQIIKCIRPHIERMCRDEEAQLVLFTALDVVDDTKLVGKSIISEITAHASSFALDSHKGGRRALLYLLVPRTTRHFTPATNLLLAETDAARARTSKKDNDVREKEIRTMASEPLLKLVSDNMDELIRDPGASLLVTEILLYSESERDMALNALLTLLHKQYPTPVPSHGELTHIIDIPHASRVIKTLIQGGHYDRKAMVVHTPSSSTAEASANFVRGFIQQVTAESLRRMSAGNGAFIIAELVTKARAMQENDDILKKLREVFADDAIAQIITGKPKGMDVLVEQLRALVS